MNNAVRVTAIGMLVAAVTTGLAHAETIFLTCTGAAGRPQTLTIDTDKNTVDNLPATINQTSIDWQRTYIPTGATDSSTASEINHIDRTTGAYTSTQAIRFANGNVHQWDPSVFSCVRGDAPKTKF